jgi:hypothetical protein
MILTGENWRTRRKTWPCATDCWTSSKAAPLRWVAREVLTALTRPLANWAKQLGIHSFKCVVAVFCDIQVGVLLAASVVEYGPSVRKRSGSRRIISSEFTLIACPVLRSGQNCVCVTGSHHGSDLAITYGPLLPVIVSFFRRVQTANPALRLHFPEVISHRQCYRPSRSENSQ